MAKVGKASGELAAGKIMLVGLGNPGPKYELTRHNVGFLWADRLADRFGIGLGRTKFSAIMGTGQVQGRQAVCLKPQTYMNLSGQSVAHAVQFYGIAVGSIIVAHDDVDLPFGTIRLKRGGGAGGHKGLRSIDQLLGDRDYFRIRLGVGRPSHRGGGVTSWVLQRFGDAELSELDDVLQRAVDATSSLIVEGLSHTQNSFHGAESTP